MSQVAVAEKMPPVEVPQKQDAMVSMLERVLMDPSVPVERLERLLELQDRERQRQAKQAYTVAMAEAQSEMRVVIADKNNSQTKSRYASYAQLDSAVRPIYTKHGFSVTFDTEDAPGKPEYIRIVADVSSCGFERRYHIDMPTDGKGAKGGDVMTKTHAVMSAASYGKRGLLVLIFNIPVADRWDDDGNAAGQRDGYERVTAEQIRSLRQAMADHGVDEGKFCDFASLDRLEDMSTTIFDASLQNIRRKTKKGA